MASTTLLLIRHAQSSGQAHEADLTAEGHTQSQALADWLRDRGVDALFASPYRRAQATLLPFSQQSGLPIAIEDGLRERRLAAEPQPDWRLHIKRSFADRAYRPDGGESLEQTYERACDALRNIDALQPKRAAVAAHGNLIASIFNRLDPSFGYEAWEQLRNPDVFSLTLRGSAPYSFEQMAF